MLDKVKHAFIWGVKNVTGAEVVGNGNEAPVVIYERTGRRYLVEVTVTDVTDDPFYKKDGLFARLAARRKAQGLP